LVAQAYDHFQAIYEMELLKVAQDEFTLTLDNRVTNSIDDEFIEFFLFLNNLLVGKDSARQEPAVVIITSKELEWFPDLVSVDLVVNHNLPSESLFFNTSNCFSFSFNVF
jgi:hypothetical protein